MKCTINKLGLALAVVAVIGFASVVKADDPHSIDINVSVSATKSLTINATYYNFAAIPVSSEAVSASSITVTNGSNGMVETYNIQGADAQTPTADTWTLSTTTIASNTYMLAAMFNATIPGLATFGSEDRINRTVPVVADGATILTNGGETGYNVAVGTQQHLWFKFYSPTAVNDNSNHKATLTLSVQ